MTTKYELPILPLRDVVVFPNIVVPLFVGREKSVKSIDKALAKNRTVFLSSQMDSAVENPTIADLFKVGITAKVVQMLKLPDGTLKVLVEGQERCTLESFSEADGVYSCEAIPLKNEELDDEQTEQLPALMRAVQSEFKSYVHFNKKLPPELIDTVNNISEASKLAYNIATYLPISIAQKQEYLEEGNAFKRLEKLLVAMESEISVIEVESKIRDRVKGQMEKNQRDYYLNEQLKAIHKELGEGEEEANEFDLYEKKIQENKLSKEATEKAQAELRKLKNMSPMSAEATVVRNYLDWLLSVPWNKPKKSKINLEKAEKILNEDHDGLEKVKERILEYLAVQARLKTIKGQIICFVGPPGVGKTSLARSIARAVGRDYVRISLGGVRDESEIRGHRRTYIGSMPGRLIQGMKKAKTSNPLVLLDELDKLSNDWRGDPSSALLEVLDPAQNKHFNDHYLEVDYDLSQVMFIATANSLDLPQPLLDRMEIIRLSGYTEDEKIEIAKHHLIGLARKETGAKKNEITVTEEALRELIRYYTREAGVRNLYREIAALHRKGLKRILEKKAETIIINPAEVREYLGVRRFKYGEIEATNLVGVTTGLAWTQVGGDLLQIEAVVMPGKGEKTITGKLGEVMKESIQAAHSYVRSRCYYYGISPITFENRDIHIHVPEGATPKDGPSAGIGMCTSIISTLTNIPVRKDVAMTGEVTLRGRVLEIGGLKEKLLAAHRGGIKTVIIPADNEKDLEDIPTNVKENLKIVPVQSVEEVIPIALEREPVALVEADELDMVSGSVKGGGSKEKVQARH